MEDVVVKSRSNFNNRSFFMAPTSLTMAVYICEHLNIAYIDDDLMFMYDHVKTRDRGVQLIINVFHNKTISKRLIKDTLIERLTRDWLILKNENIRLNMQQAGLI